MDEDSDTQEDSDPESGESFYFTPDEDVDTDTGKKSGSNTDGYVWDLDGMWKYAAENILQVLSNVYEKEISNSNETKRRKDVALREARTKVQRLALYTRLMTEVQLTLYSAWFLGGGGLCELTGNSCVHDSNRLSDTCPSLYAIFLRLTNLESENDHLLHVC